jgi:hypothetical protein
MPSTADVTALSAALRTLSDRAKVDLVTVWRSLPDPLDFAAVRDALDKAWPDLIASYAEMGSAVAADVFEVWAADLGLTAKVEMVDPVDPARAGARMGWAIGTPEPLGNLSVVLDELVKQPARSTIARSAVASGAGWARVPNGATCAFCLMLASRGAVYTTARSAGDGRKFHGECDCSVVLVRDARDYPEHYDPAALYDEYIAATVRRGKFGAIDTKATLAEMRTNLGTN